MKTLKELKEEIQKYQYMEDTSIIDVSIATILANSLKLSEPIWFLIIGASSGGKSQILRPLSMSNEKFMHRVDDLTENTFLSGAKVKGGEDVSLLNHIGTHAMIVISDFTVIMSKGKETRASILSQLRMIYDGEMTKNTGNSATPLTWKGHMGIIAGSTPSVYKHFAEVADMGERFICYRMKDMDDEKATHLALNRSLYGRDLDDKITSIYQEYISGLLQATKEEDIKLTPEDINHIAQVAMFAERIRTTTSINWKGDIDRIPVPAKPMRVAIQLKAIAMGLSSIRRYETGDGSLTQEDYNTIDWTGYSLANEENRAVLKILASQAFDHSMNTSTIADILGLETTVTRNILQNLGAVGILKRNGSEGSLTWTFKNSKHYDIVRRIEHIQGVQYTENRQVSEEDEDEMSRGLDKDLEMFGVN